MKRIGYLGMGAWGYCLAYLLAEKQQHDLTCWTTDAQLAAELNENRSHPRFPGYYPKGKIRFTTDLEEALFRADLLVESVTSKGLRPVCQKIREIKPLTCPLILTSKGIEQNTGEILPEVAIDVLGDGARHLIGLLSGPSFAQEVIQGFPTSVVGTAYSLDTIHLLCETFNCPSFRVYPNSDILGVAFGGALKNVIAIACGVAEGLGLGYSARAALMTRGLHEIRKLALACGSRPETIYGLAGMGDLCLTCSSTLSRNFQYGFKLAQGASGKQAQSEIGMVVEGAYTCVSALQLGRAYGIDLPIAHAAHAIIYEGLNPKDAVRVLMQRTIKEEHL